MEIQSTVKELSDRIRQLKISPETIVRVIIDIQAAEEEEKDYREPKKSKWAAVADRISETSLSEEAAECLRNASREFRENFRFRSPLTLSILKMTIKTYILDTNIIYYLYGSTIVVNAKDC